MTFDPRNPGRPMETYDPNWAARWESTYAEMEALKPEFGGPTGGRMAQYTKLQPQLLAAHDARFEFTWEYDEMQRSHYRSTIETAKTFGITIDSPAFDASPEDMRDYYAAWSQRITKLEHYIWRHAPQEWGNGIFARNLPPGVTRETFHEVIECGSALTIGADFLVEDHGEVVHVCAVQGPRDGVSIPNNFERVAEWAAERYLKRPRLTRLLRRGKKVRAVRVYWTSASLEFESRDQHVFGVEITPTWLRGKVALKRICPGSATPLLGEEALKQHEDIWPLISDPRYRHPIEKRAAKRRRTMS